MESWRILGEDQHEPSTTSFYHQILLSPTADYFYFSNISIPQGWHFIKTPHRPGTGNLYSSFPKMRHFLDIFRILSSRLNCFVSWSLSPRQPNISVLSDFLWYEMKSSNHRDEIFVESFIVGIMPGVINGTSLASKCKTGFLNQLPAIKIFSAEFHFKAAQHHG